MSYREGVTTGEPRGTYSVGRERRQRILDAASDRFRDAGYAATSLADIARDTGLTTPGVKHHFPTKQHLLLALAERRYELGSAQALRPVESNDGTRALRIMYNVSRLYASQPDLMELFVLVSGAAADPSGAAHSLFAERYERTVAAITEAFLRDVDAGFLRDDVDYRALARECLAVGDGLQLQWVLSDGAFDIVGMTRAHLERLAPSILRSGSAVTLD